MATQAPPPNSAFLAPKYWPTWLAIALLCMTAWLPFRLRIWVGAVLGRITWLLARERRYITSINIHMCFPELSPQEQAGLVYQAFIENGIGLIETATGWVRPAEQFRDLCEWRGGAVMQAALAQGKGVVLLGGHYSTLDFCANLLSLHQPFAVTYRAHKNPLFDAFMLRGRLRNCNGVFDRKDIRGAFRHLKNGKVLWYAPDQDYGPEQAVYAPFFGQPAATITAASRFATFNQSPVLFISHQRVDKERKYIIDATLPPQSLPTGDEVMDAILINQVLEQEIRKAPAQYLWMHKRFKTRPGGKPESPYIFISTPNRKLSAAQYAELTKDAHPIAGDNSRLQLSCELQLWSWPGLAHGWRARAHPALQLDRLSKWLRSSGVRTVTVDSIFRFPHLHSTGATLCMPMGSVVTHAQLISAEAAAHFLSSLHQCGCSFRELAANNLWWDGAQLALCNPLVLRRCPGTAAQQERFEDLLRLAVQLQFSAPQTKNFQTAYLQQCNNTDRKALEARLTLA